MTSNKLVSFFFLSFILLSGCSSKTTTTTTDTTSDPTSNTSQGAMNAASSSASSSEGGSVGFIQEEVNEIDNVANYVDPSDSINPLSSACTLSSASSCSGSTATISWAGCTVAGGKGTLTGGWTEVFSSGSCVRPLANGITMTRTSSGETMTHDNGSSRITDTNGGTAWDGTTIPNTGDVISNSAGTRTIVIHGRHEVKKNAKGTTQYDHFLTSTGLTVTGSRAGTNRIINGSITLFHNLAKFTAVNTFNAVTYGDATCCYPTSGNITSVLSGSKTGTVTLTFSSTCGASSFTESGVTSALTLDQCN